MKPLFAIVLTACFSCVLPNNTKTIVWCVEKVDSVALPLHTLRRFYKLNIDSVEGRRISLVGSFSYNMEDIALYPNNFAVDAQGIWLEFSDEQLQKDSLLASLNSKKVQITGTVSFANKGHLNSYYCSISDISCFKEVD